MFDKLAYKIRFKIVSVIAHHRLNTLGIKCGKRIVLAGIPIISKAIDSEIEIGDHAVLCSNSEDTALGVNHPVILRTMAEGAVLKIGNNVGMSGATICAAKKVIIGANAMLGANVMIMDTDFHLLSPQNRRYNKDFSQIASAEVVIGENVFLGANVIVLKGVHIGDNSVIGAGSLVAKDIPANVIAAGNPCKVLSGLL